MWTKNIEIAIRAFLLFRSRLQDKGNFRLIIAGSVDEKSQAYLGDLRSMVVGRDDVEFIMSPSDDMLWNLYANCYAVLFPSFNEDWGIVPLEANAYGKPVIATNRGGPCESQLDGQTGFLVAPEPQAFAQAMECLADDAGLLEKMGRGARENVQKYDWTRFVKRMDTVLEEVGGRFCRNQYMV
jgi:glycosyltransferase involved in cell wall biosynthesis